MKALEILQDSTMPADEKLDKVFCKGMLPVRLLHEFMIWCVEYKILPLIKNPDPQTIAGFEAKKTWIRDEITDNELSSASMVYMALNDASFAADVACAMAVAGEAATAGVWAEAVDAAIAVARQQQVDKLIELLEAKKEEAPAIVNG